MYTSKKFSVRPWQEVEAEIRAAALTFPKTEKVFLADGDALVLSNKKLLPILNLLYELFPQLQRVTAYALPKNLLVKSVAELKELKQAGLTMIYYGVESGDPVVLDRVAKGATREEILEGMEKAHQAGLIVSTTNLLGLGGKKYTEQHAINTASLLSAANPKYISFLTVMFPLGEERLRKGFKGEYEPMDQMELMQELRLVVYHLDVKDSIFRTNHASNYLPIGGNLPEDRESILKTIDSVLENPASCLLRPEHMRGL
jgi:radical SAM superfamily enzyme YgiQ (UPF0313 family)